ncbi:hypothetical protein IOD13_19255 [Brevibacterium casei]|nr:hypothetical protein [Brevibacterium casei]
MPENWITTHLDRTCRTGHGLHRQHPGYEPRADVGSDDLIEAWFATHHLGEGHDHVFGANLGIRAPHFVRIDGCPPSYASARYVTMVHAGSRGPGAPSGGPTTAGRHLGTDARSAPRRIQHLPTGARRRDGRPPRRHRC